MKMTPKSSMPSYSQQAILLRREGVRNKGVCVSRSAWLAESVEGWASLNSGTFRNGDGGGQQCLFVDHNARAGFRGVR